jgi:hypothetical protein
MGGALVAHIGPFAGYSTCSQVLFFRHSSARPSFALYPLTKSVGHQTSSTSCPSPYDAHKNIRWSKRGGVSWGFASQTALINAICTWGNKRRPVSPGHLPTPQTPKIRFALAFLKKCISLCQKKRRTTSPTQKPPYLEEVSAEP